MRICVCGGAVPINAASYKKHTQLIVLYEETEDHWAQGKGHTPMHWRHNTPLDHGTPRWTQMAIPWQMTFCK
jgi:hypothetical protein